MALDSMALPLFPYWWGGRHAYVLRVFPMCVKLFGVSFQRIKMFWYVKRHICFHSVENCSLNTPGLMPEGSSLCWSWHRPIYFSLEAVALRLSVQRRTCQLARSSTFSNHAPICLAKRQVDPDLYPLWIVSALPSLNRDFWIVSSTAFRRRGREPRWYIWLPDSFRN